RDLLVVLVGEAPGELAVLVLLVLDEAEVGGLAGLHVDLHVHVAKDPSRPLGQADVGLVSDVQVLPLANLLELLGLAGVGPIPVGGHKELLDVIVVLRLGRDRSPGTTRSRGLRGTLGEVLLDRLVPLDASLGDRAVRILASGDQAIEPVLVLVQLAPGRTREVRAATEDPVTVPVEAVTELGIASAPEGPTGLAPDLHCRVTALHYIHGTTAGVSVAGLGAVAVGALPDVDAVLDDARLLEARLHHLLDRFDHAGAGAHRVAARGLAPVDPLLQLRLLVRRRGWCRGLGAAGPRLHLSSRAELGLVVVGALLVLPDQPTGVVLDAGGAGVPGQPETVTQLLLFG